jgi:hypothetical protein
MKQPKKHSAVKDRKIVETLSGKVLTGLTPKDKVIYQGKEHTFIDYRDFGFTCMIKPNRGKEFLVFGSQINRHFQYPPTLDDKQKKLLQQFLDSFLKFDKFTDFRTFQKSTMAGNVGDLDRSQADFLLYHLCSLVKNQHKTLTKIIQKG